MVVVVWGGGGKGGLYSPLTTADFAAPHPTSRYCEGGCLQDFIDNSPGGLDEETIKYIAYDILQGLHFIHECESVHRDVKPQNMLIDKIGRMKVSDFGLTRELGNGSGRYLAGDDRNLRTPTTPAGGAARSPMASGVGSPQMARTFVGTTTYMSPERLSGEPYGFSADVWGLGMSLLTAGLGRFPIKYSKDQGYWHLLNLLCGTEDTPVTAPSGEDEGGAGVGDAFGTGKDGEAEGCRGGGSRITAPSSSRHTF